ncbi:aminoglycoside phosphotransferase family protein [Calothrix membranacea FACHB-236]|nr:aminoglycoside phosphotransferase family protein [Calothrix membranacea FACHB-236]
MTFLLNAQNVCDYLARHNLCSPSETNQIDIELKSAKNFNLLLTLPNNQKLLVKQERHNHEGKTSGEFLSEWRIQEFIQKFPELNYLRPSLPEILHYDAENSIMVARYLDDYQDLMEFYTKEKIFDSKIAAAIGNFLANIHRHTFNHQEYQAFLSGNSDDSYTEQVRRMVQYLEIIEPEIFGLVPTDGLRFFALYQRFDSLGTALKNLGNAVIPCCLTHNDLKLNNILVHKNWQQSTNNIIRIIDWERSAWGDPAFDLGTLISSYVQLWLGSLVISKSLSLEESLSLAMTPLEKLQPSIATLTQVYLQTFPEILKHRPDFLLRVMQFTGFALIQGIQAMIQYQKSFGNTGIAMLQVAKSLLCRPEQSIPTIFGAIGTSELIQQTALTA